VENLAMSFILSNYYDILLRLFLALFLGGIIGLEREFHGRPAGLRTHILVCLGSTIIIVSSELLSKDLTKFTAISEFRFDPGRIIAGIVTGIGFLGAGAIIRIGDLIRGLTTAACIWFTAALGIVIGSGHYFLAIVSTIIALIILIVFNKIEFLIPAIKYQKLTVIIDQTEANKFEEVLLKFFKQIKIRVQDISHQWNKDTNEIKISYRLRTKNGKQSSLVVMTLGILQGVKSIRWE
jgi:putative Mg2+ transporter-C (MgtC) family protein